jgi:hypothetical protein
MATKLQLISELSEQTAKEITNGPKKWTSFLTEAARLYKYSFDDQLLIYAQRPDATACATVNIWNSRMHRWVNKGSKGIALIDHNRSGLKYVFDMADTHPGRDARDLQPWQMREEYTAPVLQSLEKTYGALDEPDGGLAGGGLTERLMELAARYVRENYGEYLDDLMAARSGSFLEDLDELNAEVIFRDTLTASVQYTLLSRCGLDAGSYFDDEDFRGIVNFNTARQLRKDKVDLEDMVEILKKAAAIFSQSQRKSTR